MYRINKIKLKFSPRKFKSKKVASTQGKSMVEKLIYTAAYASKKGDRKIGEGNNSGVFDICSFPFLSNILQKQEILYQETKALLQNENRIPSFQDIAQLSEKSRKTEVDKDWKNWMLFLHGEKFTDNCSVCPGITKILEEDIPGVQTALLSILHPNTQIKPHTGERNGMLRLHLPIIIPSGNQCGLKVGNKVLNWANEDAIVFDHSVKHSAWNNSNEVRVILIVDFSRDLVFPWWIINKLALLALNRTPYFRGVFARIRQSGIN